MVMGVWGEMAISEGLSEKALSLRASNADI